MCQEIGYIYQMIPFPEDRKAIDVGDLSAITLRFVINLDGIPKCFEDGIQESLKYFREEIEHYL